MIPQPDPPPATVEQLRRRLTGGECECVTCRCRNADVNALIAAAHAEGRQQAEQEQAEWKFRAEQAEAALVHSSHEYHARTLELQQAEREIELLKEAVTAANAMSADIRAIAWEVVDRRDGDDRSLVGLVRQLANKLLEARDNRRGEFERAEQAESALARLRAQVEGEARRRAQETRNLDEWWALSQLADWIAGIRDDGAPIER